MQILPCNIGLDSAYSRYTQFVNFLIEEVFRRFTEIELKLTLWMTRLMTDCHFNIIYFQHDFQTEHKYRSNISWHLKNKTIFNSIFNRWNLLMHLLLFFNWLITFDFIFYMTILNKMLSASVIINNRNQDTSQRRLYTNLLILKGPFTYLGNFRVN